MNKDKRVVNSGHTVDIFPCKINPNRVYFMNEVGGF